MAIRNLIKTRLSIITIIAFQFTVTVAVCWADKPQVFIVDSADKLRTYDLTNHTSLYDVAVAQGFQPPFDVAYVISKRRMYAIKSLRQSTFRATVININDLVIFGLLTPEREAQLRQHPEVDAVFKALPPSGKRLSED